MMRSACRSLKHCGSRHILSAAALAAAALIVPTVLQAASSTVGAGTLANKAQTGTFSAQIVSKKKKKVRRGSHSTTSTSTTGKAPVGK